MLDSDYGFLYLSVKPSVLKIIKTVQTHVFIMEAVQTHMFLLWKQWVILKHYQIRLNVTFPMSICILIKIYLYIISSYYEYRCQSNNSINKKSFEWGKKASSF